ADKARIARSEVDSRSIRTLRTGSEAGESRAGSVIGTPAYMSPQQARGALGTVDERPDVFGLGSVLCEVLTGNPVHKDATELEVPEMAERGDVGGAPARLERCAADCELVSLGRTCIATAPKYRPRDARAIAAALSSHQAGV